MEPITLMSLIIADLFLLFIDDNVYVGAVLAAVLTLVVIFLSGGNSHVIHP